MVGRISGERKGTIGTCRRRSCRVPSCWSRA
jgi:hypothetical protein